MCLNLIPKSFFFFAFEQPIIGFINWPRRAAHHLIIIFSTLLFFSMAVVTRSGLDSDKRGEKYKKVPFVAIVHSKETQRSLERREKKKRERSALTGPAHLSRPAETSRSNINQTL